MPERVMPFWEYIESVGIPPFRLKVEISSWVFCVLLLMDSSDCMMLLEINVFAHLESYMAKIKI